MNNNDNITKHYVVHKQTLQELYDMYMSTDEQTIWKWENTTVSEKERAKAKQSDYSASNRVRTMLPYDRQIERIVRKKSMEIFLSGYTGDIVEKIKEETRKSEVKYIVSIRKNDRGYGVTLGEEYTDNDEERHIEDAIEDNVELEKELSKIRVVPFLLYERQDASNKVAMLSIEFKTASHTYKPKGGLDAVLSKKIKAFIRKELTYCIKQNKNIVPKEYLDRGKAGIKEWQALKQSQNKNNSLERTIVRDMVREKKAYMDEYMLNAMKIICNSEIGWSEPRLNIDGLYNQQRRDKQRTRLLSGKSKDDIMKMSNAEMQEIVKDFWKQQLKNAIDRIDKIETE